jgi:SAM-dependent methyltransferase
MEASAESTYRLFAEFYDTYVAAYRSDLPLYLALAAEAADPILEIGVGTGRVLLPLVAQGHRVTGVDVSGAMLDRARQKIAIGYEDRATLLLHDLSQAPLPGRYGLVLVTFFTFNYLLDPESQRALLGNISACMSDEARLALHLFHPAALNPAASGAWIEKGPLSIAGQSVMLRDCRVMLDERIEERTQVFVFENGRQETIRTLRRYSTPTELGALLRESGFECLGMTETLELQDLAPIRADSARDFIVLARKAVR